MKFRYAARVQRSLIEHEALLDISPRLTRINCEIPEMREVETARGSVDEDRLRRIMQEQAFDRLRESRWLDYLAAAPR